MISINDKYHQLQSILSSKQLSRKQVLLISKFNDIIQ